MSLDLPEVQLPGTNNTDFRLSAPRNAPFVVYFYPKDNTPGCTTEAQQFRDLYPQFQALGVDVFGISRDSVKSHENFKAKYELPFELISDQEEKACEAFNVIKMKNMYGKKVRGIERSTFVFDADGSLRREWRGVKVAGHAQEVLDFVKTLTK